MLHGFCSVSGGVCGFGVDEFVLQFLCLILSCSIDIYLAISLISTMNPGFWCITFRYAHRPMPFGAFLIVFTASFASFWDWNPLSVDTLLDLLLSPLGGKGGARGLFSLSFHRIPIPRFSLPELCRGDCLPPR